MEQSLKEKKCLHLRHRYVQLFPSKNLGGFGDGGCLVTNNKKYFIKAKKISNHGGLKKFAFNNWVKFETRQYSGRNIEN